MARICTVCAHPQRQAVDEELLRHAASYQAIAGRYGLARTALQRHEANHMKMSWQASKALQAALSSANLLDKLSVWHERMERQYQNADSAGNISAAVATARTAIATVESYAKIGAIGELERRLVALEHGAHSAPEPDEDEGA